MGLKIGSLNISSIKVGSLGIDKIYQGTNMIYENNTPTPASYSFQRNEFARIPVYTSSGDYSTAQKEYEETSGIAQDNVDYYSYSTETETFSQISITVGEQLPNNTFIHNTLSSSSNAVLLYELNQVNSLTNVVIDWNTLGEVSFIEFKSSFDAITDLEVDNTTEVTSLLEISINKYILIFDNGNSPLSLLENLTYYNCYGGGMSLWGVQNFGSQNGVTVNIICDDNSKKSIGGFSFALPSIINEITFDIPYISSISNMLVGNNPVTPPIIPQNVKSLNARNTALFYPTNDANYYKCYVENSNKYWYAYKSSKTSTSDTTPEYVNVPSDAWGFAGQIGTLINSVDRVSLNSVSLPEGCSHISFNSISLPAGQPFSASFNSNLDLSDAPEYSSGMTVSSVYLGTISSTMHLTFGQYVNSIPSSGINANTSGNLKSLRFEIPDGNTITIPNHAFYYKNATSVSIYTDNTNVKNYNWSSEQNITPTFYHLDGTAWA